MADQQNRGGKKEGQAGAPGQTEKHQGTGDHPRPPEGQPGGQKPREGQTRTEHHKK